MTHRAHRFLVVAFATVTALVASGCAAGAAPDEDPDARALAEEDALGSSADELNTFRCDGTPDEKRNPNARGGNLSRVRAAAHAARGFDRFVMQFTAGTTPDSYVVRRQATPSFQGTADATEVPPVTVRGEDGIRVVFMSGTGDADFAGTKRFSVADGKGIQEIAQIEEFEGNIEWALGTKKAPCFRTWTLNDPPRLIVDVRR
jgi:hypothetical protein